MKPQHAIFGVTHRTTVGNNSAENICKIENEAAIPNFPRTAVAVASVLYEDNPPKGEIFIKMDTVWLVNTDVFHEGALQRGKEDKTSFLY